MVAHARWRGCLGQAAAGAALLLLLGCKREAVTPAPSVPASPPVLAEQLAAGAQVYEMTCAQCHFAGEGGPAAPPLAGSSALARPESVFKIILQGQRGQSVVNGQKLNGIMPAMNYLTDEEVAAVTAYLRERFGGKTEAVQPADVAKARTE